MGLEKRLHIKADPPIYIKNPDEYVKKFKKELLNEFSVSEITENNGRNLLRGKITDFRRNIGRSCLEDGVLSFRVEKGTSFGAIRIMHIRYDYLSKENKYPNLGEVYKVIDGVVDVANKSRY